MINKELKIIRTALEKATAKGSFNMDEVTLLMNTLQDIKIKLDKYGILLEKGEEKIQPSTEQESDKKD